MTRADRVESRRRGLDVRTVVAAAIAGLGLLNGFALAPAVALEVPDEPLTIAVDEAPVADEPVGESVGETAEDGPVEGEPGAGEAPDLPLDDSPPVESDGVEGSGDGPAQD